ncbi:RNA polymerase subunit sigma-70 [Dokdonia sp. Dokd-P16]|uniref:RNA polymerase sigma factor n=1 Tax=Dokdonia sp. Dokd-P16 TaxID=2173169 RepID=UPI000D543B0C|nr:sigma-70 family RNA polymerase sigma factor [Dokdonia sp. Dokd-P16]AWH75465.1 RNA polymerase subunit sigma-70 [Dokdonia sp. Dokd-P16]
MKKEDNKGVCHETIYNRVFKAHSKNLFNFLYYKFGNNYNPEDKVQEAFIKLWENCAKVSEEKAKSYLFTIANNLTLNAYAHQKVVLKFKKNTPKDYTNETPEFVLEEQEYQQKLEKAIANLTEAQRTAFLLNRVEGKKHKEIAALLGISTKAVEKRIYGALKKLKIEITELR